MKKIAVYGKGGSGKSTITSNISAVFARSGHRTLQIGCDPKRDSTLTLMRGRAIPAVISVLESKSAYDIGRDEFLAVGEHGVGCIEAGGPEAGVGCAGRGIVSVFSVLKVHQVLEDFDVVLLDVLGDVVCGGFAAPLMHGVASTVAIVVSDNLMSMYAANNIARAVRRYQRNGVHLAGLIANDVREASRVRELEAFAERLNSRVLAVVPHDPRIRAAERERRLVTDLEPGSDVSRSLETAASELWALEPGECAPTTPMDDVQIDEFFRSVVA